MSFADLCDVVYVLWLEALVREATPFAAHVEESSGSSWLQTVRAAFDDGLARVPSAEEIQKAERLRRIDMIRGVA